MNKKTRLIGVAGLIVGSLLFLLVFTSIQTDALNYGSGKYGTCTYGTCGITLTTSGTVNLTLTPNASGVYTIQKDDVTVTSGATTGYNLTLESNTASTALVNGANTIPSVSGSFASPAVLSTNTWGYRLDGIGSFGAGPTSAVTNASSSSLSFAALPANASPDTVVSTTAASAPTGDNYQVWYGVKADMTPPAGTYSQTLLYTATQIP